ncbi:hypothetical protein [Streptosporangium sp. NPDC023615]|uniref:hypothetical protein n=1 Tax=Streptosporangium sp. NPDC023615 TaxID=3154794 RepID=UPI003442441D
MNIPPGARLSPSAQRLLDVLNGPVEETARWPDASRLGTALGAPVPGRRTFTEEDRRRLTASARELVEFDTGHHYRLLGPYPETVAAGLAGMDAEVSARLAGACGPIAAAELRLVLGWEVERRALFAEAMRMEPSEPPRPSATVLDWLATQPGYLDFARTALETAEARVTAIHAGEIPYAAGKGRSSTGRRGPSAGPSGWRSTGTSPGCPNCWRAWCAGSRWRPPRPGPCPPRHCCSRSPARRRTTRPPK